MAMSNVSQLLDTIEAQQKYISVLEKQVDVEGQQKLIQQLQAESAARELVLKEYCKNIVKYTAENIRLQQEVSNMREAIQRFVDDGKIMAGNESFIVKDSIYWKFKKLLSAAPTDYHNPACELDENCSERCQSIVKGD